nr:reverse transcriptase domain-containing protein [Tanacetum cinerariifolium]
MVDNLTMEELLQAPTEGYGEAIFIPEINADYFEIKTNLLQLVQVNPYHGFERENPHTDINNFKRITSTLKFRDVPDDVIKLMMFPYYLEGNARVWDNASKSNDMIDKLADQISTLVDIFAKKIVTLALVKAVEESCLLVVELIAITQNQSSTSGTILSNNIPNPKGEIKAITTQSAVAYDGPSIPTSKKNQSSTSGTLSSNNIPNPKAMLLKKLPKKLGDPDKFFIPCDFSGMDVCHALADLGASINLMPLSILKKHSLSKLIPTRMTLELADRSITRLEGVAEDVFVKVEKFHFLTDFVVVDFEADPRVSLILGRSFLRTDRALIDVYVEEITLRVNDEAITFNLNQTTRYSSTYDDFSINRIDMIDVAREEYAQEILGFSSNSLGGNSTSTFEPILSDSSPSLTPFEGSDFILEEIDAYLKDESISPEINHADCDPEGDICLIENLLNDDPFQLPLMDLKQGEVVKAKSLIEEPPELELKELPSHLEYAYLEGVRSFLRHAGFYQRFIQDFSKIARPMSHLLEKETLFFKECIDAFETLKKKLTEAMILVVPNWNLPFELMCDASDFAIGAVLGQPILSGADNRPPMLEKDMYDSWKSRMELYMMNRQHGRMILESVENGPLL